MQTPYIQSQLARNATLITALLKEAADCRHVAAIIKADEKYSPDEKKEQRNSLFTSAYKIGQRVNALADIQKQLKKDLRTHPFTFSRWIKKVGAKLRKWWRYPELM